MSGGLSHGSSMTSNSAGWSLGEQGKKAARRGRAYLVPGHQDALSFVDYEDFPRFFDRAEGPFVWDVDGRRYTDLYCGSGAIILGHADPTQVDAVSRQLAAGASLTFRHPAELDLAEWLASHIPTAQRVMLFKTGSEANQAALRVAMAYADERPVVLSVGYHGWLPPYCDGWPADSVVKIYDCPWDLAA